MEQNHGKTNSCSIGRVSEKWELDALCCGKSKEMPLLSLPLIYYFYQINVVKSVWTWTTYLLNFLSCFELLLVTFCRFWRRSLFELDRKCLSSFVYDQPEEDFCYLFF